MYENLLYGNAESKSRYVYDKSQNIIKCYIYSVAQGIRHIENKDSGSFCILALQMDSKQKSKLISWCTSPDVTMLHIGWNKRLFSHFKNRLMYIRFSYLNISASLHNRQIKPIWFILVEQA